jgi:hypothetical protein
LDVINFKFFEQAEESLLKFVSKNEQPVPIFYREQRISPFQEFELKKYPIHNEEYSISNTYAPQLGT